jgi:hypothetical protein
MPYFTVCNKGHNSVRTTETEIHAFNTNWTFEEDSSGERIQLYVLPYFSMRALTTARSIPGLRMHGGWFSLVLDGIRRPGLRR